MSWYKLFSSEANIWQLDLIYVVYKKSVYKHTVCGCNTTSEIYTKVIFNQTVTFEVEIIAVRLHWSRSTSGH